MESNVVTHIFCIFSQVSAFMEYFPLLLKPMLCQSHQGDAIPSLGSLTLNLLADMLQDKFLKPVSKIQLVIR